MAVGPLLGSLKHTSLFGGRAPPTPAGEELS